MVQHSIDLAHEAPFDVGSLHIDPAHRRIAVDGRDEVVLEPKVMQVLVALAREPDRILSRDDLIETCWDGIVVGDDAINRVISQIRKRLQEVGAEDVSVETVTKVGYQLCIRPLVEPEPKSRSRLFVASAVALLLLAATAGWLTGWFDGDPEVEDPTIALTPVTILTVETATPDDDALAAGLRSTLSIYLNSTGRVRVSGLESAADLERYGLGPQEIGERLEQDFVIALALEVSGGLVEVRLRKHDVAAGQVVSKRTFRRPFGNLEMLQSDLAQAIVGSIPVPPPGDNRLSKARTALAGEDEAIFLMAIGLMRTGSYDGLSSAEDLLRQLASRHPQNGAVLALLSVTISERLAIDPDRPAGKFHDEEALALARKARAIAPDLADAQVAEAVAFGPVVSMLPLVERAAALDPINPSILNLLAGTREVALDFEGAWEARYRRWKLEPLDGGSTEIATEAAVFGMDSLADQFDREYAANHLDPNERLRARSRMAERQGDMADAVRLRFEALSKEPGTSRTYNLGRLALMRAAVGLKDPNSPSPIRVAAHKVFAGELPSAKEMEESGFWGIDFFMTWRLSRATVKLMVDEGRHEELLAAYDHFFDSPDEFRVQMVERYNGGLRKLVNMAPYLVIALREVGREDEADRMLELAIAEVRAAQRHGRLPEFFHVEAARIYAVAGDRARAIRYLETAIEGEWHLSFPQEHFPGNRDASSDRALAPLEGHPVIASFDAQLNGWRDRERPKVKEIFDEWDERFANDVYH